MIVVLHSFLTPGYRLVSELRELDYEIIPLPGPSALTSAISVSGLPVDKFSYLGFLPKSEGKRKSILEKYGELGDTLVIYESPHRLIGLLDQILEVLGDRRVFSCKRYFKKKRNFYLGKSF